FNYTIRVDDNSTSPVQFGLVRCSINILGTATPLVGACSTPAGTAGASYSGAITASGGAGQYRFTLSGGALPPGLSINSAGSISGTIAATASGSYPFATTITDAANATVVVNCSIQVTALVIPVPAITALNPAQAVVGSPAFTLAVTGSNFASSSVLVWNGFDLATTFVSSSSLSASIPANLLGAAGVAKIRIRNTSSVQSAEADFEVFSPLSISSISPVSLAANGTATQITINGDGFFPAIALSLNGTRTTVSRLSSRQLEATVPANLLQQPGVITARLENPNGVGVEARINVLSAVTVTPTVSVDKPALVTDQSTAIVRLAQAAGQALTGVLDITFVPAADNGPNNGANDFPRFSSASTRRITFNLAATATEFRAPIDQGSVAGTATITLTSLSLNGVDVLNGQRLTQTLTIDAAAPLILPGSVAMVRTATGFNVEITALSTQRSLTGGTLTFTIASGITNSGSATFSIDNLAAVSTAWFQSDRGKTEGGGFKLTLPYTLEGDFNNLSSVQVVLTNSRGSSTPVSGGRR
ncbi:MAG: Ig domain-containing protein, partial [Acidobacteria bacterium]|nr:Ig domain-containing protein [Acidobacteriota bacterium]